MSASTQIFLRMNAISGGLIKGEAFAEGYLGQIEIDSFTWGMSAKEGLRTASKINAVTQMNYDKLSLQKVYDRSSPSLAEHMTKNFKFKDITVTVDHLENRSGSFISATPVVVIELSNVFIESIKIAATEGDKSVAVRETVELSYTGLTLIYVPYETGARHQRLAAVTFFGKKEPS